MSNAGGSYEKAYASCYHAFVAIVFDAVGGAGGDGPRWLRGPPAPLLSPPPSLPPPSPPLRLFF